MIVHFSPFHTFIQNNTTDKTRARYADSQVKSIDVQRDMIFAMVRGTSLYSVEIYYNKSEVTFASCSCPYDSGGACKHIVNVLVQADHHLNRSRTQNNIFVQEPSPSLNVSRVDGSLMLLGIHILKVERVALEQIRKSLGTIYKLSRMSLSEADYEVDRISCKVKTFSGYQTDINYLEIEQKESDLRLFCNCSNTGDYLCEHLFFAINEIKGDHLLQLPFDSSARTKVLIRKAEDNGWDDVENYDELFKIRMYDRKIYIEPKVRLLPFSDIRKDILKRTLLPEVNLAIGRSVPTTEIVMFEESAYGDRLIVNLVQVSLSKNGTIKSPLTIVESVKDRLRNVATRDETLFYSSFVTVSTEESISLNLDTCWEILRNPVNLDFYLLDTSNYSGKINPKNLIPIKIQESPLSIMIVVKESGGYFSMSCMIVLDNIAVNLRDLRLFEYFFLHKETLYCLNNENERKVILFFEDNGLEVFVQKHKFESFKSEFLDPLEDVVKVSYSFMKVATRKIIQQNGFDQISKRLIYLSELDDFILITPVVSYGENEISVLSKRTLYIQHPDGNMYSVSRNGDLEQLFIADIQIQHKNFESSPQTDFYHLHKKEFLESGWFIEAFDAWRKKGYVVLGFDKIKNNRYNQNKISVRSNLKSGIDWFDLDINVSFGDQLVPLKHLQKSALNKSRYVELNDGTLGILPEAWSEKIGRYFRAGEIKDGSIRTHKSNFKLVDELFQNETLSHEIQLELSQFRSKLQGFKSIARINAPKKLKAKLRDYQIEGLNWLNFLDEFNFGGCLADDMGLGKTVQIIAYMLSQHEKGNTKTNLVIVPTSLLFNWERELEKFAPHLRYITLYGSNRNANTLDAGEYDLILTTYGTLISDISVLREIVFNLIVLDESQAIKNPESKRYKSVCLLQGRQRIVVTGTPVENNTFDLFAQLSFAMPGLLGNAKRFAVDYSTPIDKFQDGERAKELQQKIYPFVLRRTKQQVATELPEKTEVIHYCEMGTEQKKVYNAYRADFRNYLNGLNDDEVQSSSLHILQGITKLRQICNSPALLPDQEYYGDDSAKVQELIHQVKALEGAHKILIFSQFVGMLDLIKNQLENEDIDYAYLTGKTKKREQQVERFQEDESIRVFLISLKAGGTGLNLTKAEYVFLVDPWWNPAVENQAIDRAYRIGQQKKVIAIRFITPDSIEEKIMQLQQRKRQLADELVQTDNNVLKSLTKNDLINLL